MNDDVTECKLKVKECNEFPTNSCSSHGNTCFKVKMDISTYYSKDECKVVTVNERCQINNGICTAKLDSGENALKAYEKCSYNSDYTRCEPINKECSEITDTTQCSKCQITKSGFTCSKIKTGDNSIKCDYVQKDLQCEINENGECLYPSSPDTAKKTCIFNSDYSKCQYYEAGNFCKLSGTTSLTCIDNTDEGEDKLTNNKLMCDFDETTRTKCNTRQKECSDYITSTSCKDVKEGTKKCSWNYQCEEYTIVEHCTVKNGKCQRDETVTDDQFGTNQVCLFDLNTKDCKKKEKKCENYYENCGDLDNGKKKCVEYNPDDDCISIEIDDNCQISRSICTNQKALQSTEICSYNDETKPSTCQIRRKVCGHYETDSSCNYVQNWAFIGSKCYQPGTDGNCVIQDGDCKEKTEIEEYEKCDFNYKNEEASYICEKRNKLCEEYGSDSTKCYAHPRTTEHQCFKFSSSSTCQDIKLDGNCYVNKTGQCVEDGSGKLSTNEICDFNIDKTKCGKREKGCNDYKDSICGNYSP